MRAAISILAVGLSLSVASAALAAGNGSPQDAITLTSSAPMTLDEFSNALRTATGKAVMIGLTPSNEYRRHDRGHRVRVNWNGPLAPLLNGVAPRFGLQWAEESNAILLFDAPEARPKSPAPAPAVTTVEVAASTVAANEQSLRQTTTPDPLPPVVLHTAASAGDKDVTERRAAFVQTVAPVLQPQTHRSPVATPDTPAARPLPIANNRKASDEMPPVVTTNRPEAPALPPVEPEPASPEQVGDNLPPVNLVNYDRVTLDAKEAHGVQVANQWKSNPDKPRQGEDGSVKYLYGATLPTLVCAPLEVCAIQLQPGEMVNDIHAGDTRRWRISPASSGAGPEATTLVVVKPTDAGLTTNLFIATDRRTYTIKLVSTQKSWIPLLAFDYPEDLNRAWASFRQRQTEHAHATTLPTGQSITNLDFSFRMTGDRPNWKPQRIYTDGVKTYIQFPSAKFTTEAPALVALGKSSGIFSEPATQIINYRVQGDLYVVDQVIDRAALISGAGKEQTRVIIEYKGR